MTNTNKSETTNSDPHNSEHLNSLPSMSSKIRYLSTIYVDSEGKVNRGRISKILGIKYQWVRNVLITPLKGQ